MEKEEADPLVKIRRARVGASKFPASQPRVCLDISVSNPSVLSWGENNEVCSALQAYLRQQGIGVLPQLKSSSTISSGDHVILVHPATPRDMALLKGLFEEGKLEAERDPKKPGVINKVRHILTPPGHPLPSVSESDLQKFDRFRLAEFAPDSFYQTLTAGLDETVREHFRRKNTWQRLTLTGSPKPSAREKLISVIGGSIIEVKDGRSNNFLSLDIGIPYKIMPHRILGHLQHLGRICPVNDDVQHRLEQYLEKAGFSVRPTFPRVWNNPGYREFSVHLALEERAIDLILTLMKIGKMRTNDKDPEGKITHREFDTASFERITGRKLPPEVSEHPYDQLVAGLNKSLGNPRGLSQAAR